MGRLADGSLGTRIHRGQEQGRQGRALLRSGAVTAHTVATFDVPAPTRGPWLRAPHPAELNECGVSGVTVRASALTLKYEDPNTDLVALVVTRPGRGAEMSVGLPRQTTIAGLDQWASRSTEGAERRAKERFWNRGLLGALRRDRGARQIARVATTAAAALAFGAAPVAAAAAGSAPGRYAYWVATSAFRERTCDFNDDWFSKGDATPAHAHVISPCRPHLGAGHMNENVRAEVRADLDMAIISAVKRFRREERAAGTSQVEIDRMTADFKLRLDSYSDSLLAGEPYPPGQRHTRRRFRDVDQQWLRFHGGATQLIDDAERFLRPHRR